MVVQYMISRNETDISSVRYVAKYKYPGYERGGGGFHVPMHSAEALSPLKYGSRTFGIKFTNKMNKKLGKTQAASGKLLVLFFLKKNKFSICFSGNPAP